LKIHFLIYYFIKIINQKIKNWGIKINMSAQYILISDTKCTTTGWCVLRDKHLWFYAIIVVIIAIIAAIIISKGIASQTFMNLIKPDWNPSATSLIIVWVIIYLLIGYAWFVADRIAHCGGYSRTSANILFALNIFLSISYIYLFYSSVNLGSALTIIILLLLLTIFMIWYFYKISNLIAGILLIYFVWQLAVLYLIYQTYSLNPQTSP
jgi:tryptophan-rich sensory protein